MSLRWKPALVWSTIAFLLIVGLEVWVRVGAGSSMEDALQETLGWVVVWPALLFLMFILFNWRRLIHRFEEARAGAEARRQRNTPMADAGAACPSCGIPNPNAALVCDGCGIRLRELEVVHALEMLPGAKKSVSSLVYVASCVLSFLVGGVAVAAVAIIDQRLLERDWILIGSFLVGASGALVLFFWAIRVWVRRSEAQGRRQITLIRPPFVTR